VSQPRSLAMRHDPFVIARPAPPEFQQIDAALGQRPGGRVGYSVDGLGHPGDGVTRQSPRELTSRVARGKERDTDSVALQEPLPFVVPTAPAIEAIDDRFGPPALRIEAPRGQVHDDDEVRAARQPHKEARQIEADDRPTPDALDRRGILDAREAGGFKCILQSLDRQVTGMIEATRIDNGKATRSPVGQCLAPVSSTIRQACRTLGQSHRIPFSTSPSGICATISGGTASLNEGSVGGSFQ
jgi:hypothetical protein